MAAKKKATKKTAKTKAKVTKKKAAPQSPGISEKAVAKLMDDRAKPAHLSEIPVLRALQRHNQTAASAASCAELAASLTHLMGPWMGSGVSFVYPVLVRLERVALVASELVRPAHGHRYRVYKITQMGARYLHNGRAALLQGIT